MLMHGLDPNTFIHLSLNSCIVTELPVDVSACFERSRRLFNITLWSVRGVGGFVQGLRNQKSSIAVNFGR